jgi:hypothetical protein
MQKIALFLALVAGASAFTTPALNGLTLRSPKTGEIIPLCRKNRPPVLGLRRVVEHKPGVMAG